MDADAMSRYIEGTFAGIGVLRSGGDTFYWYDPDGGGSFDQGLMFATVVTSDAYDAVSDLDQPGAYRINMGVGKPSYTALFGAPPKERDEGGVLITEHDHSVRDRLLPHPYYASQYWVGVVNPGIHAMDEVKRLLDEAYRFATRKADRKRARRLDPAGDGQPTS